MNKQHNSASLWNSNIAALMNAKAIRQCCFMQQQHGSVTACIINIALLIGKAIRLRCFMQMQHNSAVMCNNNVVMLIHATTK
jgi:hypothetical protein